MAKACFINLFITATKATFFGLPFSTNLLNICLQTKLCLEALRTLF